MVSPNPKRSTARVSLAPVAARARATLANLLCIAG